MHFVTVGSNKEVPGAYGSCFISTSVQVAPEELSESEARPPFLELIWQVKSRNNPGDRKCHLLQVDLRVDADALQKRGSIGEKQ